MMSKYNKLKEELTIAIDNRKKYYDNKIEDISKLMDIQNELWRVQIELSHINTKSLVPNNRRYEGNNCWRSRL